VRDKLKASKDWATIEQEQSLHNLITQVEKICVGFDDHKQDVFNLVQALKMLFLYARQGGRGGRGGRGTRGGQGDKNDGDKTEGGNDDVSTMTGKTSGDGARTNSKGESHCFNCGSPSHWAYECPQLSGEQQAQLHMNQEAQEDIAEEQAGEEGRQMMHVTFSQGKELPDDRAYLDGCSMVTAFKNKKFLENLRQVKGGIKINCNAGAVSTDVKGDFGGMSVC